ncbi:ketopantoate reductase family protein [Actinomyces ruminicola]|uniref:Ketopantoate reductase PanE/ApbA n=1 Tax=Actinomyces ruminicola TaxID=332524 RepID=A0A1G9UI41_9ACTO|nr:2-dehydropantoate 2-reductase N-terminal domain-containing protein [Actinomyces ruminicola]SDM59577.1 Ketopantoate reductase PanE/ApbA [Actinomyces ruminicola]
MRILIIGAGVIGLSYGWLLSRDHQVVVMARPHRAEQLRAGVQLRLHRAGGGRRGRPSLAGRFRPGVVDEPVDADLALVAVDRTRLGELLPMLEPLAGSTPLLFMLNHWDIVGEVSSWLAPEHYCVGFPGQIGGGHTAAGIEATLFDRGTRLEAGVRSRRALLDRIDSALAAAGLTVKRERDMPGWLAVHYLQQSLTLGPLLEAGGYDRLCADDAALRRMVLALREGVAVCRARGIATGRIPPAPLLRLPVGMVAAGLGRMFSQDDTRRMVLAHLAHGRAEWRAGFFEVLAAGRRLGVPMPIWDSYSSLVAG